MVVPDSPLQGEDGAIRPVSAASAVSVDANGCTVLKAGWGVKEVKMLHDFDIDLIHTTDPPSFARFHQRHRDSATLLVLTGVRSAML